MNWWACFPLEKDEHVLALCRPGLRGQEVFEDLLDRFENHLGILNAVRQLTGELKIYSRIVGISVSGRSARTTLSVSCDFHGGGRHEPQRYYRLLDHGLRAGLRRFYAEPAGGNQPKVELGQSRYALKIYPLPGARRNVFSGSGPAFGIEHGKSSRLCGIGPHCRLRSLDPRCRPKLQRTRFMDLRRSHPHSGRSSKCFRSLARRHARLRDRVSVRIWVPGGGPQ